MKAFTFLESVGGDLRYALRGLSRRPAFTSAAVLTLALGIGGTTAIFSIMDGVLLKPLPYAAPDQLVRLYEVNPRAGLERNRLSLPDLEDWQMRSRAFSAVAGYVAIQQVLTGRDEPLEVRATYVTPDFFAALDRPVVLGRALDGDDAQRASRNVVISSALWQSLFGGQRSAVGATVLLGGAPFTIVGVAASDFRFPTADNALWIPQSVLADRAIGPRTRENRTFDAIARLAPGETVRSASAKVNALAAALASEYPASNDDWSAAAVVPLRTTIVGDVERALTLVFALVALILLLACANVAHLMLARGAGRAHEMWTRMALGADAFRVARQSMVESGVLSALGGALGLGVAYLAVKLVLALYADSLPRADDVAIDVRVLGFACVTTLTAGALFGALPALRLTRFEPRLHLRSAGASAAGGGRARRFLIVAEVALAMILVVGAGLMAHSFLRLRSVDPGFDADHVLTVTMQMNIVGRNGVEDLMGFLTERRREITERVRALPGVAYAAMTNRLPLRDGPSIQQFRRVGGSGAATGEPLRVDTRSVSPEYFRAMGIPLLAGTTLTQDAKITFGAGRDRFDGPRPLVVSAAAARRFWPGQNALGKRIAAGFYEAVVVGVVGDVRQLGLADSPAPTFYMPETLGIRSTLVVRTTGDPQLLAGSVRAAIRSIDPDQAIHSIADLRDVTSESIGKDRFFTLLYATFGGLALLLAGVGVYGVVAYAVALQTRELGLRVAVGARDVDILRRVVTVGIRPVLGGVALGAAMALPLAQLISRQLYGISATDPATLIGAPCVLILAALIACYLPARRAARIDPIAALRAE